jgi:Arc/MetJ-type ribon-helix-helix transcriptional regulator
MSPIPKAKITITLANDLLAAIDRRVAAGAGPSRSAVIEAWLRRAARRESEATLARDTVAYYESLSAEARDDDEAWANAATAEFDQLATGPRRPRRGR